MIDHRKVDNYFVKLDFVNPHLAPEFRCYYDRNNNDYIMSKALLFYLLQKPRAGISRQIAMQKKIVSACQTILRPEFWIQQLVIQKENELLLLSQSLSSETEISGQIAIQSQLASGQFEDLSKMVSLKELAKSSQISSIQLEKIKQEKYTLDHNAWFKVSQNGEIILTKKMLLEALQQVSKSRDEKFFSEHFSYIAKDFDSSQPSQYSAQSLKDYKDWLVGLNKDRILQSNIEQLKIDCQNGLAGERINLQNFLTKSDLESNLLDDINNYFRKIFASNLKENQKTNYFMHTTSQTTTNPALLEQAKNLLKELYGNVNVSEFNKTMYSFVNNKCRTYTFCGNQVLITNDENFVTKDEGTDYMDVDNFINKLHRLIKLKEPKSTNEDISKWPGSNPEDLMPSPTIGPNQIAQGNSQLSNTYNGDNREQTNKIVSLLSELNSLNNPGSKIDLFGENRIINFRTQKSTFILDENSQRVTQSTNLQSYNRGEQIYPIVSNSQTWSYDEFIKQLTEQIANKKSESHSWQSTQTSLNYCPQTQQYQPFTMQASQQPPQPVLQGGQTLQAIPQPQTQQQYQQFTMLGGQTLQATPQPQQNFSQGFHQPAHQIYNPPQFQLQPQIRQQSYPQSEPQLQSQPVIAETFYPTKDAITLPSPQGIQYTFPPGSILWNNFRDNPFCVTQSALPCGVGGATMAVVGNHMPSQFNGFLLQGSQHQGFATSQPMPYPQLAAYPVVPRPMPIQPYGLQGFAQGHGQASVQGAFSYAR